MPELREMFARMTAADIAANLIEPEMKPFRCREAVLMPPGFQQRLLHHIFKAIRRHAPHLRQAIEARTGRDQPRLNVVEARGRDILVISEELRSQNILSS